MQVEALPASKLGTQEYWNDVYDREISTFEDIGDEGEIWFGEEAVQRMVDFIEDAREEGLFSSDPRVLDVGTGNGHLLFELLDLDPPLTAPSNMLGIDYSKPSIELCKKIASTSKGEEASKIPFEVVDFLLESDRLLEQEENQQHRRWDLICDKGTLDAIALSAADPEQKKDPISQYVASMSKVCPAGSIFLLASCNFTEEELLRIFAQGFEVHKVLPCPSFSFGGQKGSTTTTIAFQRKE